MSAMVSAVHSASASQEPGKSASPSGSTRYSSRHVPPTPPPPDVALAIANVPSDSAMTEATLALEGTASQASQATNSDRNTEPLQPPASPSTSATLDGADPYRSSSARTGHTAELLTASDSVSTSTPTSTLARAADASPYTTNTRPPKAPGAPVNPSGHHSRSSDAASPACRKPPSPPYPGGSMASAATSRPLSGNGSPHSAAAHHSESDTCSDFIPALNPPSPSTYTPRGVPWRPLSPRGSLHDANSPLNSGEDSHMSAQPPAEAADGNAQRGPPTRNLQARAFFAVRPDKRAGAVARAQGKPQADMPPRHRCNPGEAALERQRANSSGPSWHAQSGRPVRHTWPNQPPDGEGPNGQRPADDNNASRSLWAANPSTADVRTRNSNSPSASHLRGNRGGHGQVGIRNTSAVAPRSLHPLSSRSTAGSMAGRAAAEPSEAMQLVTMKRAELERAARELAELEALAATRRSTVEAFLPSTREGTGGVDRARTRPSSLPAGPREQRGGLVDASSHGRPQLPLQLRQRETLDLPEPPRSARGSRISAAQVQVASDALRSLEESRAHLAAIQAAAGQRPSSRRGAFRAPGPHSSGVVRRGARYTLDEAALILKSLPAVPEGDHPAADGADIRRRPRLERFLADVQQQPPAKRGDADADYRRMARSLQDQAFARLWRRSGGGGGGSGPYPNMGPTSQESLYNMSVASAPAYAAQSPAAMRPSAAYRAAGKPPKSAGSVGGSNPNGGMFPLSWDGGAEGACGSSPPGSQKLVVSGGGLSSSDVDRLRQRAKRPGSSARPNIDSLLDTLGSQGAFDSIGRNTAAAASTPSAAYRAAAAAATTPHSTGSTLFESVLSQVPPESLSRARASREAPPSAAGGPPSEQLGPRSAASVAGGSPCGQPARLSTSRPLSVGAMSDRAVAAGAQHHVVPVDTGEADAQRPRTRSYRNLAFLFCIRPPSTQSDSADSGGTPGSQAAGAGRGSNSGKSRAASVAAPRSADGPPGTEAAEGADANLRRKMRQEMRNYEREVAVNCGCF